MTDTLSQSDRLAELTARSRELFSEAEQLRTALARNILDSRELVEQLDELRAEMLLGNKDLRGLQLEELETAAVLNALDATQGNRTHAAQMLGISVRTIQRKLKSMGWMADGAGHDGAAHNGHAPAQRAS
jgi:DNA-binding NtrC family response regulator